MSKFFDETMQGLLEAVAIEKGEISLVQKENMPAPTFIASDKEKEHSPSLKLFYSMVDAVGYELRIVKKEAV